MTSMKCGYVFFMELGILCSALLLKASCFLQVLWNLALLLFIVLSCGKASKRISLFHILKIKIETKSHDFGNYPLARMVYFVFWKWSIDGNLWILKYFLRCCKCIACLRKFAFSAEFSVWAGLPFRSYGVLLSNFKPANTL